MHLNSEKLGFGANVLNIFSILESVHFSFKSYKI